MISLSHLAFYGTIENMKRTSTLKWWDIALLTLLLFGQAIYHSTLYYLDLMQASNQEAQITANVTRTATQDYQMFLLQAGLLGLAVIYLALRGFEITRWFRRVGVLSTLAGIALFILVAGLSDVLYLLVTPGELSYYFQPHTFDWGRIGGLLTSNLQLSTVLYAMLNGFYEEIYFIGICLSTHPRYRTHYFLFSLLVRFAFHTYQGLVSAAIITLVLGPIYFILHRLYKEKSLYPIILSHILADIFGLSILYYLFA